MYDNVFPTLTRKNVSTEFTEYESFKKTINSVKNSFVRADMRSERMSLSQRIDKIMMLEEAQQMLFDYAIKLRERFDLLGNYANLKMVNKLMISLSDNSTMQVNITPYGDWIINTPLLGLSHNAISYIIYDHTTFAIRALGVNDIDIPRIKTGCILVKIYGDISKMAHTTLENRELHAITDTFMDINGTDDNPENFSFMYSWGYSATPDVQIIICPEERAHLYKNLMFDFGNPADLPLESQVKSKRKERVIKAFNTLEEIFEKYPRLAISEIDKSTCSFTPITTKQINTLAAIMRRLTTINTALRNPSIFPKEHATHYYTKGAEPKDSQYKCLFEPDPPAVFEFNKKTAALTAYCESIKSCYSRSGKILADFLDSGFRQYADWYSAAILAAVKDNPPMGITVERYIISNDAPDGDNINLLGAGYKISNGGGRCLYDFRDNIMIIKSKIINYNPHPDYDDFPTKITLSKAEDIDMDFYRL